MRTDIRYALVALCVAYACTLSHAAADPPARDAVLKRVSDMESAMNALDLEGILRTLDPDVTVTWQHGGVARGHKGVREYWQRVFGGGDPPIKRFSTRTVVAPQAVLYGSDVAVVSGAIRDHYVLKGDVRLDLDVYWSATALRGENSWRFIAVHFSNNTFDNAVLDKMKKIAWYAAGGSVVAGAAAMWFFMRVRSKSKPKGE